MADKKISDLLTDNEFDDTEITASMAVEVYDPSGATATLRSGASVFSKLWKAMWRLYPTKLNLIIDGGGSIITTGIKRDLIIPFNCTITGYTIIADQTTNMVVDLWTDSYANYPPTNADSITDAGTSITLTGASKATTTTLTGWTTTLTAGNVLRPNVDSCSAATYVTIALDVKRTG